jgi:hypothetical protein
MSYVSPLAGPMAAVIAGRSTEMDIAANRGASMIRQVAAAHRLTGAYIDSVGTATVPSVQPSKVGTVDDRLIYVDDPGAVSIEHGHLVRYKNARRVRYVPGQHIVGRALELMG